MNTEFSINACREFRALLMQTTEIHQLDAHEACTQLVLRGILYIPVSVYLSLSICTYYVRQVVSLCYYRSVVKGVAVGVVISKMVAMATHF